MTEIGPDYSDPFDDHPITLFTYDPTGNLTSQTDSNGNVTDFLLDIRGRRTKETAYLDDGMVEAITQFLYDDASQLVAIEDPLMRRTDFRYDDAGRLIAEVMPDLDGDPTPWQNEFNPFDVTRDGVVDTADGLAIEDEINRVTTYTEAP